MAHDTTINAMTGGDVIVTYDLGVGGAYPSTGKVPASVLYVSPDATTAPTPVTTANPFPVGVQGTVTVSGSVSVGNFPATQAISAASLPLPTGAATSAKQPALGTAGAASADVLTVQGIASMTALKVDGSAVTQPVSGTITANAGTGTRTVAGNVASGSADSGNPVKVGGVFNTALPTLTTGQRGDLQLDSSGRLIVNVGAGSSGNAAASATGSAVPASADYGGVNVAGTLRGRTGANPSGSIFSAHTDLTSVGGTSLALGQATMAGSLPVAIASNQGAVPVSGTVTVAQATGTNLHAVIDSGTISASQNGTWNVGINAALPAGTNQIGHVVVDSAPALAAGSASIGTVGLNAGTNLVGVAVAPHQTGALYSGTTALTPKFAAIAASSSGSTNIVALVGGKKIRVLRYSLNAAGAVNAKFVSNGGSPSDLTGLKYAPGAGPFGGAAYCPLGLFETAVGEPLAINLSGAVGVGGELTYVEV